MKKYREIPIFTPFFVIIDMLRSVFIDFPLWMVGFWRCDDCNKRYSPRKKVTLHVQHGIICRSCYQKSYQREF